MLSNELQHLSLFTEPVNHGNHVSWSCYIFEVNNKCCRVPGVSICLTVTINSTANSTNTERSTHTHTQTLTRAHTSTARHSGWQSFGFSGLSRRQRRLSNMETKVCDHVTVREHLLEHLPANCKTLCHIQMFATENHLFFFFVSWHLSE